ncbi:MAG: hypothetical protein ACI4NA_09175 [Succinivibrio sp.]
MDQGRRNLIMALESADIAAAFVTVLLLIVPPMGILAGFCPESAYLVAALFIEGLAWAGIRILRMHLEAEREYAQLVERIPRS